ncbi:hypothetical protein CBM2591_B80377 [Cupriavidus taiwanensis]|nr:hypothetical protein CBM2591_B80377 [Cupriavidus taiwanensis]
MAQLLRYCTRRAFGHDCTSPRGGLIPFYHFGDCWHLRQARSALCTGHCERAQFPGLYVRKRGERIGNARIDFTAEYRDNGRCTAFIRHVNQINLCHCFQHFTAEMIAAAVSGGAVSQLAGLGLR